MDTPPRAGHTRPPLEPVAVAGDRPGNQPAPFGHGTPVGRTGLLEVVRPVAHGDQRAFSPLRLRDRTGVTA